MATAKMVRDDDFERDYKIRDGRVITLKLEEDYSQITFWDSEGEQLGNDEDFCFVEDDDVPDKYLLSRMYVPFKGFGLGRAAIEFFKAMTDAIIWTRPDDGIKHSDGSYLTEDAPGFILKMQKEGLIYDPETNDNEFY